MAEFQFTHPARGATTEPTEFSLDKMEFQFTHPARGATRQTMRRVQAFDVSIHAPRTGCDRSGGGSRLEDLSFNSRTPHGVRHVDNLLAKVSPVFQFTHPARGATYRWYRLLLVVCWFQFTHPARGATTLEATQKSQTFVSIHAPRTGCDS